MGNGQLTTCFTRIPEKVQFEFTETGYFYYIAYAKHYAANKLSRLSVAGTIYQYRFVALPCFLTASFVNIQLLITAFKPL